MKNALYADGVLLSARDVRRSILEFSSRLRHKWQWVYKHERWWLSLRVWRRNRRRVLKEQFTNLNLPKNQLASCPTINQTVALWPLCTTGVLLVLLHINPNSERHVLELTRALPLLTRRTGRNSPIFRFKSQGNSAPHPSHRAISLCDILTLLCNEVNNPSSSTTKRKRKIAKLCAPWSHVFTKHPY
jgi:hypothetical protein